MTLIDYIKQNPEASDGDVLAARNAQTITVPPASYAVTYFLIADDPYFDPDIAVRMQMSQTLATVMAQAAQANAYLKVVDERLTSEAGMDLGNSSVQVGISIFGPQVLASLEGNPAQVVVQSVLNKFSAKGQPTMTSAAEQSIGRLETQTDVDAARAQITAEKAAVIKSQLRAFWTLTHNDVLQGIEDGTLTTIEAIKAKVQA